MRHTWIDLCENNQMHRFDTILKCCETQVPHCTYHLKGNTGLKWLLLLGTYQVNLGSCHRGTRVETNILQRLHSSQNLFRFPVFSTTQIWVECCVKQLGRCNHHLQGRKKESGERKQFKSTSRHEKTHLSGMVGNPTTKQPLPCCLNTHCLCNCLGFSNSD